MTWQEARSEMKLGAHVEVQHGGFGSIPGVWSEVFDIKGPVGFGLDFIMVKLRGSIGYILVSPRAEYRVKT